jgi:protein CpxP
MNKVKFLTIVVVGLVISNIALIVFMFCNKPAHPKHLGPRNLIIEKLGFDEAQVKAYDKIIEWHQDEITKTEKEVMVLKNQLYSTLATDAQRNIKDSLINEISKVQLKVEQIHYKHFEDIQQLCNADQQHAFKNMTKEIAALFAHPPIKGRKK